MAYYSLARAAAGAFIRGAAGSLGRRAGSYRRRRRVRWPSSQNRASNSKKLRTFVKKTRTQYSSRNVRRLWRAVKALQRTSDPDVTITDVVSNEFVIPNEKTSGAAVASSYTYQSNMTANLTLGDQYKMKSFNEQLTFRLTYGSLQAVNASQYHPATFARHARVIYILTRDELFSPTSVLNVFTGFSNTSAGKYVSSGDSIYPSLVQNPGVTYRIVYDKTYTVRSGVPTNVLVRIPASVFYDRGTIKFRNVNGSLVQQNNFLYRIIIADSISEQMIGDVTTTSTNNFDIVCVQQNRWKYYDFGRSVATALSLSKVSEPSTEDPVTVDEPVNGS